MQVKRSRPRPAARRVPRTPTEAACSPGPLDRSLDPQLFAALGDPTRARILACIAKCARPCSVGEVAGCCAVDLSVVSRHLKVLALAGALESSREGRVVRYRVRAAPLAARFRELADLLDRADGRICRDGCC